MSTYLPTAARFRQLSQRKADWPHRYTVRVGHLTARQLADYLEFLELIYEHKVLLTNHPDCTFLTLTMEGRSEAGFRFVSWLYGVAFEPVAAA